MSALVTGAPGQRMTDHEVANALLFTIEAKHLDKSIEHRENRLRDGARAIMQMWDDLQAEKGRRAKVAPRVKRKILSPA